MAKTHLVQWITSRSYFREMWFIDCSCMDSSCEEFILLWSITVDLEIFFVKIFSWFAQTTKIKNTKYILQRIIIIAIIFCSHNFAAQLASYFTRDGLFDTSMSLVLMANAATTFRSVSDKSSVYCHSTCLLRYLVPFCTLVVRQQLHGSHECSMQAVRTLSVRSFVSDH